MLLMICNLACLSLQLENFLIKSDFSTADDSVYKPGLFHPAVCFFTGHMIAPGQSGQNGAIRWLGGGHVSSQT